MVLPLRVPVTVASAGAVPPPPPPPPGLAGLPLLPHPSMRDATVTNEIACAQNSRREVFGLSMRASLCNQCTVITSVFAVTSRGLLATVLVIPLVCGVQIAAARSQGQRPVLSTVEGPLQVSFSTPTARPGDVVRIDINGLDSRERITATMFDQELAFYFDEARQRWSALV